MLVIRRAITGLILIMARLFMEQVITIDRGIIPITIRDRLPMVSVFITIHGPGGVIHSVLVTDG